jgi:hypothetical protein
MIPITSKTQRPDLNCRIRITSSDAAYVPMGLKTDSLVLTDSPMTIKASLITAAIGVCPPVIVEAIDSALRHVLAL